MNTEQDIIQTFDAMTSSRQNELLQQLIQIAVKLDTTKVLTAIVDKVGCEEVDKKLTSIITDFAY